MNRDTMLIIIASLFFLVVVTYTQTKKQKSALAQNLKSLDYIRNEAIGLDRLKKKWKDKKLANKIISQIKNPKTTRNDKSGKNFTLEFENLNRGEVDKISNKVLNSTLKIKEFSINRTNEFNATMRLKVVI